MRSFKTLIAALAVAALSTVPAFAQQPQVFFQDVTSLAGIATAVNGSTSASPCAIIKYVGTTAGKPDVAVAAGGDMTLRIAGVADSTTGSPSLNGVFDLSTPAAAVDTMGELVNLVNTTGSNWRMVLVGCLASDFTDNAIDTLSVIDAAGPGGVVLFRDAVVASATSTFSAQVALYPEDKATDIRFHLSGSPVGATTGSTKVAANPLNNYVTYVQNVREKITSTGTIGLFEILGVRRTYDSLGKVNETVRTIWSETGAATTVEKAKDFNSGPIVSARGEVIVVRQRTGTDLTVQSISGNAYAVRSSNK